MSNRKPRLYTRNKSGGIKAAVWLIESGGTRWEDRLDPMPGELVLIHPGSQLEPVNRAGWNYSASANSSTNKDQNKNEMPHFPIKLIYATGRKGLQKKPPNTLIHLELFLFCAAQEKVEINRMVKVLAFQQRRQCFCPPWWLLPSKE